MDCLVLPICLLRKRSMRSQLGYRSLKSEEEEEEEEEDAQLREKAEGRFIPENIFDRVSNGIVDALKDFEHILEMGGVGKTVFT
ncbi:hypothetical protein V6N11_067155 [Hibiscus sabdariffa]|uniref:Uncharacterized protein n=1 Tax=Hibiscus sabdariffa TaxID=183260 RepID=A0ABR2SQ92_9ROSI